VLEEVVLLLADGYGDGPAAECELVQARDAADLRRGPGSTVGRHWRPVSLEEKWTPWLLSPAAFDAYTGLLSAGTFVPLQAYGETTLGMVTGANGYFTMSPAQADRHRIRPSELLRISPPGSRHLRRPSLTGRRWRRLGEDGRATYLFRPPGEPSADGWAYIARGERTGVDTAYKCRVRSPWWRVPRVPPADLLLTYMNADAPRLCANPARVHHLNSVHGVYLREPSLRSVLPLAALSTATLVGAETVGRAYGGGMLKLEPREGDQLPMPSRDLLTACAHRLTAIAPLVEQRLRGGDLPAASALVDQVLLAEGAGVPVTAMQALRDARTQLHDRRLARGAAPRG
jgi:adenine-specific DNA-methyltransferase